eukprot:1721564-Ditylum_brightwellii.AAC.1
MIGIVPTVQGSFSSLGLSSSIYAECGGCSTQGAVSYSSDNGIVILPMKCPLNQTITTSGFEFFREEEGLYNVSYGEMESHLQRPEIAIACCVAYHQLALCLRLMKRAHTLTGKSAEFDVK